MLPRKISILFVYTFFTYLVFSIIVTGPRTNFVVILFVFETIEGLTLRSIPKLPTKTYRKLNRTV